MVAGLMSQVVVDLMQTDGIHVNTGQPRIIRQLKDLEIVLVLAARVQMGQHIMIIVVLGMIGCVVRQLQLLLTEHDGLTVLTVLERKRDFHILIQNHIIRISFFQIFRYQTQDISGVIAFFADNFHLPSPYTAALQLHNPSRKDIFSILL